MGGWLNASVADWFEEYARLCFTQFGDDVRIEYNPSSSYYSEDIKKISFEVHLSTTNVEFSIVLKGRG